ncbi:MotA/TolQ/ExbB proton channel family protein [Sinanaerobacter sp. ZZT-01]|uniref:MotA/TolQ/ExbB proton channel family protein n=1 Tax=Sinanaerobacter sp. ZZT-01 TaxID=3111540 RepID=UPI002D7809E3|nr:MotA/TolQ/ExbB proton channel family protein [Sinanaerobacter sp. ZZT-01]WRR92388.1 MotA/TolQ/ExbB proton channel family protein [Sinanaerobacter sp. ZZT-01]
MTIPGSEYLTKIIHAASQCLLIPVIIGLIILLIYGLMELGSFLGERRTRKKRKSFQLLETAINTESEFPWQGNQIKQIIEKSCFSTRQTKLVGDLLKESKLSKEAKELIAKDILDQEEAQLRRILNKTDLLAKVGPILGLMGTLIPLGPGLAALGQGDFVGLSEAIIVAFDTTVVGMLIGAVGALISKIRNAWYNQDLNTLEMVLNLIIGGDEHA